MARHLGTGESAGVGTLARGLRLENADLDRFVVRELMRRQPSDPAPVHGEGYRRGQLVSAKKRAAAAR